MDIKPMRANNELDSHGVQRDINSRPNSVDSTLMHATTMANNLVDNNAMLTNNHFYHYNNNESASATPAFGQSSALLTSGHSGGHHSPYNPVPHSSQSSFTPFNPHLNPVNPINPIYNPNPQSQFGFAPQTSPSFWSQNSDYLSEYYSQYYREYYKRFLIQQQIQQQSQHLSSSHALRAKTPLKYGPNGCHSRASFSQHSNALLTIDNSLNGKRVNFFSLNDLLIDCSIFQKQFLSLLLKRTTTTAMPTTITTDGDDCDARHSLPMSVADKDAILEWIRCKQELSCESNFELKLVLKVIQLLLRQNARVSGLDLSELLFSLLNLNSNEIQFNRKENDFLETFRFLLIKGQKRVALDHALNNGLYDHALALSFLMSAANNELAIATIRKFVQQSLHASDPLHLFYTSMVAMVSKHKQTNCSPIFSIESFLILLSNDLPLSELQFEENVSTYFRHLFPLIESLLNDKKEFLLSEELFESKMEFFLINECLELSRNSNKTSFEWNSKLISHKMELLSLLFDFGFYGNALLYCQQLKRGFGERLSTTATHVIHSIESRFDPTTAQLMTNDAVVAAEEHNNAVVFENNFNHISNDNNNNDNNMSFEKTTTATTTHSLPNESEHQMSAETTPSFDFYGQTVMTPTTNVGQQNNENNTNSSYSYLNSLNNSFDTNVRFENSMPLTTATPMTPMNDSHNQLSPNEELSFISLTSAMPTMPFQMESHSEQNVNSFNERKDSIERFEHNSTFDSRKAETEVRNGAGSGAEVTQPTKASGSGSSLLSSFFGKLRPKGASSGGAREAILPDDSNMSLVFDKRTQKWIDKNEPQSDAGGGPSPLMAPPRIPSFTPSLTENSLQKKKFEFKSNKRYVDVFNKP